MNPPLSSPSGAWVIDKPTDLSSSQVVTQLKWGMINGKFAEKSIKIGHGGTLDPFATGVLLILFGDATKLADCYLHSKKIYTGVIKLGVATDSADLTGSATELSPIPELTLREWQHHADRFVNEPYLQTPPMHSAKKQNGVALYELARKGIEVAREAIPKKIHAYTLSDPTPDTLTFEVSCESGTYVRVLAEDLAKRAGTRAHLIALRRTASSDRSISEALSLEATLLNLKSSGPLSSFSNFIPMDQLATHVPGFSILSTQSLKIRQGQSRAIEPLIEEATRRDFSGRYLLIRDEHSLVALLERTPESPHYRLQRVFME